MSAGRVPSATGFARAIRCFAWGAVLCAAGVSGCGTAERRTSLCPDTPSGIPVDPDGCPLYSDADAVPDYLDACPGTAPGIRVDADGCPVDADGDGITDVRDACPDTLPGSRVGRDGCPVSGERIAIVTNINFDFDRTNVRSDVEQRLWRVIQLLRDMPDVDVEIVGYTDDVGSQEYNRGLSLRRAESVRDYMVAHGIERTRLSVSGRGMADPFVSNATPEGRAVNRRVEFVVK